MIAGACDPEHRVDFNFKFRFRFQFRPYDMGLFRFSLRIMPKKRSEVIFV
jgi:hypothetical protein